MMLELLSPPELGDLDAGVATLVFFAWLTWQVYAPKVLPYETALSPLLKDLPERVQNLEENQQAVLDELDDVESMQSQHIQVTRAQARALDPAREDETIDSKSADDYLVENGVPISELTRTVEDDENSDLVTEYG